MFDLNKANICAEKMKAFFCTSNDLAEVEIPNSIMSCSNEHIIYLFYSCLLDYGMRSKTYHSNLVKTYEKYKMVFDPHYVITNLKNNKEKLFSILKENVHPRYPNIALKKWIELSEFLDENFPDGDLKNTISSLSSYKELYNFITNIKGYGQKTGGLLLRLISDSGVVNFTEELSDIPIDRHDVEISYLNGIVERRNLNEKELKILGDTWIKAAEYTGVSPSNIDKYLWSIGAEFCSKKRCLECPLKENCKTKL